LAVQSRLGRRGEAVMIDPKPRVKFAGERFVVLCSAWAVGKQKRQMNVASISTMMSTEHFRSMEFDHAMRWR
jgi:hypothetical protein